jgi:hypothetical protein
MSIKIAKKLKFKDNAYGKLKKERTLCRRGRGMSGKFINLNKNLKSI